MDPENPLFLLKSIVLYFIARGGPLLYGIFENKLHLNGAKVYPSIEAERDLVCPDSVRFYIGKSVPTHQQVNQRILFEVNMQQGQQQIASFSFLLNCTFPSKFRSLSLCPARFLT